MHLFETLGPGRVFATAEALGISPTYLHNGGPSATLGTNEMRMLDHVAAYGAFANGGRRLHPWAIAKITDSAGHVLEDNTAASGKMEQAIPVKAAMALTDILKGAVKPDGYGLHIPLALKSGTSEHWTDSWYVGYTTDLVVGAWMGHTDAHGGHYHMHVIYGENGAGLMLSHFLRDWYHGTSPPDFGATEARGCAPTPPSSPRPSASPRPTATTGGPPRAPYQVPSVVPAASPTPCPSPSATAPGRARSSSGPAFAPGAGTGSQGGVPPGASPPPPQPQPSPRRTCIVQPICR